MERAAAADRAEAERRPPRATNAALRGRGAGADGRSEAPRAAERVRHRGGRRGRAWRAEAVDEPPTTERIDSDSPRVDLGGESELAARIDASSA